MATIPGVMRFDKPGLNLAGSPAAAPVVELFPGWTTGRVFQWSVDPTKFTTSNYTVTTDGGQPALAHTTGHEFDEVSVLTNATDVANARVAVKFRAQPASGLGITNISMKPQIRYSDSSNFWQIARDFGAGGAAWLLPSGKSAGSALSAGALNGDGALDNSDSTHYQWLVMDVFRDVLRGKTWFISDTEPTLTASGTGTTVSGSPNLSSVTGTFLKGQYLTGSGIAAGSRITAVGAGTLTISVNATASASGVALTAESFGKIRFRPMFGYGSGTGSTATTTDLDNSPETGQAGLRAMYGGIIQDVIVTELLPSSTNFLFNAALDPELVDSSGRPFFWGWDVKWNSESTGIVNLTTALGPDGTTTIPVLRCARSSAGSSGDGPEAQQQIFLTGTADNASYTRDRPIPSIGAAFPTSVSCSAWVKTTSLANVLVQIGSAQHVLYYSDAAGTGLNVSHNDYYGPLAPDTGSQAWTHVTWTTTIHDNTSAVVALLYMGMHDQGATGEVLIAGGAWAPTFVVGA